MKGRVLAAVVLLSGLCFGQKMTSPHRVTVAPIDKVTVAQGGKTAVQVMFRVAPGFHINSNKPTSDLMIPTKVNLNVPTNVSVGVAAYPEGEVRNFPFSEDEKLSVYTGDFTVRLTVMTTDVTPRGTYRVHGNLRYQACDDRACYPPKTIPFSFDVSVVRPSAKKASRRNPGQSPHVRR